jgi:TonB family protein
MYFDFEDNRPDTPTIASPFSRREGVLVSLLVHTWFFVLILLAPHLPFMRALETRRQEAIEELRRRELQRQQDHARFVFVQPRLDKPAPKPPPRAELSDLDRQARTVERAPNPANRLPFSRGNSPERIEATPSVNARGAEPRPEPAPPTASTDGAEAARSGLALPDSPSAPESRAPENGRQPEPRGPAVGVIADAIRNLQKYAQKEGFVNLQGGADQDFAPSIQFDTKGVEFGPWLRAFVAQIRRNWFIPYAAMSMRGHVVLTFYVHKDGRITDVTILRPSSVDSFNRSANNAIITSNPTRPLPPEYPDDKAFFTVTFFYNENPSNQ